MAESVPTDAANPDRRIVFDGPCNFRDLGGYPSRFGGATRWGTVYRADRLDEMTGPDLDRFRRLGIATVIDLRHDDERERAPDPVPSEGVSLMAAVERHRTGPALDTLVERDHGAAFLADLYIAMFEYAAAELGGVIGRFADSASLPALVHCTAGKDRTGVVAALVLEAVGVEREVVLDDYELTERFRPVDEDSGMFRAMLDRGVPAAAAAGVLGATRSTMATALDRLDRDHGGVEAFLTGPAGLDGATIRRLRELLLFRPVAH